MNNSFAHAARKSAGFKSSTIVLVMVLVACAGVSTSVAAQSTAAPPAATTQVAAQGSDSKPATKQLIKPGDRTCLQSTGSLIPPRKGGCLPVPGRSYSGQELRNTGAIDNAHALQMLDPGITRGH